MKTFLLRLSATALLACLAGASSLLAQNNRVDVVAPMAPELAAYGRLAVGVRTIHAVDRNRVDILRTKEGGPTARYDRAFTIEVWYPAALRPGQAAGGDYQNVVTRDPAVTATLHGQAVRDADALKAGAPFPLVIVSHGYPGNRFLMSHLCENLASKGYIVASIDHPESTYDDQQSFGSTLYNRPFDQLFVLNEMARLGKNGSGSVFAGLIDDAHTGIVGYSMGGYGLMNVIGGGYSEAGITANNAPPNRLLSDRAATNPRVRQVDPRIRAAIAVAPWGMQNGFWDAAGLDGVKTPVLFVAGSADSVAGYEKGTRALFTGAVRADRYLLTFVDANHNAGAPIPAPAETYRYSEAQKSYPFIHYADAVWDSVRMNNIFDHFATAWFDWLVKGDQARRAYLQPAADGALPGFQARTAVGLRLEHLTAK